MTTALKIDFVSDIACPWCAVGLGALEQALDELKNEVQAELHFQPFELKPHMPEGGEDLGEHLGKKYGSSAEQQAQMYQNIKARGAEVGFAFHPTGRGRIYNTFDAHRLLHWAELEGAPGDQHQLKKAFRGSDSFARISADQFAVFLANATKQQAETVFARFTCALQQYNLEACRDYQLAYVSVIVEFSPQKNLILEQLLGQAESELHQLKNSTPGWPGPGQPTSQALHGL